MWQVEDSSILASRVELVDPIPTSAKKAYLFYLFFYQGLTDSWFSAVKARQLKQVNQNLVCNDVRAPLFKEKRKK